MSMQMKLQQNSKKQRSVALQMNVSEKIGYKIRDARLNKIPYMLVVGAKEQEEGVVSVRSRFLGDEGQRSLDTFIAEITEEIKNRTIRKQNWKKEINLREDTKSVKNQKRSIGMFWRKHYVCEQ